MGTTIRQAASEEAAALAELASVTFALACPPGSAPEDIAAFIATHLTAESFARYLGDPSRAVFVAEEHGPAAAATPGGSARRGARLAGYSMLVDAPPSDADVAAAVGGGAAVELSKCYARPHVHGTGLTAGLMAASLAWAATRGAEQVWLGVNGENARARKFYEKHGFRVAGSKRFQLGNRVEHDHVMVRPVQS
ncbi:GNAT family N-acetyltransferase [Arthrobacter sp. SDTb3-6]|uniref:GNAT family N-acetyltransferase n=1 Tax=Arthrobacter sp. SDTb3-6 TaxID=2713571 RepID=UPI00159E62C9|nr:GNAT family N-acetyltransferase [Arthrobacter sp. SDTb3-6]NVM97147.1 GNAT family N-acetyltransferase [Arthrobacter sp. SDTb3-6]